jgi:hypothetical protein
MPLPTADELKEIREVIAATGAPPAAAAAVIRLQRFAPPYCFPFGEGFALLRLEAIRAAARRRSRSWKDCNSLSSFGSLRRTLVGPYFFSRCWSAYACSAATCKGSKDRKSVITSIPHASRISRARFTLSAVSCM